MAYLVFYTMTDAQRRRAWRLLCGGALSALVGGGGLAAAMGLWATPMELRPEGFPWAPADGYGLFCGVLFTMFPIGLALFLWAVANYRVDRMVRRQEQHIGRFDGMIRLWCLLFFVGGTVLLGRMAYIAVRTAIAGWPNGQVRSLFLPAGRIADVAFSPDGDLILATTDAGKTVAWDAWRGKIVGVPRETPHSLATARTRTLMGRDLLRVTTPDGQTVLEMGRLFEQDRTVVVRDAAGKERRRLATDGSINSIAMTADGKRALTGSDDQTVRLWDLETGTQMQCLRGHQSSVTCVQFAARGAKAFSGDKHGRVRAWDLEAGRERPAFGKQRRHDEVGFLSVSADGRRLLSTGRRKGPSPEDNLCVWDAESGTPLAEFGGAYGVAEGQTAVSPDGRWALTTGLSMIQLWRLER